MKPRQNNRSQRKQRPQQVRIIGGEWRRTPLPVLDMEGLRPTLDRVRETVFNWINHLWNGEWAGRTCLDMFAGTGAFGFEAASRGARHVTLIESSLPVCRQLDAVKTKLKADQVQTIRGDALDVAQAMAASGQRFDLIFIDPPYQQDLLLKALVASAPLLAAGGLAYVESAQPIEEFMHESEPDLLEKWQIIRSGRAGMMFYCLLEHHK